MYCRFPVFKVELLGIDLTNRESKETQNRSPLGIFLVSGCIAKGAKDAADAVDATDAVSGTGGDVSATGNVPVPPGMSWAPRRCLGCQASSLFSWAAKSCQFPVLGGAATCSESFVI